MSNRTPSPLCSCVICKREIASKGLFTHFERSHGSPETKAKYPTGYHGDYSAQNERVAQRQQAAITEYLKSPNYCKQCGDILSYKMRNNTFCSRTCSATCHNSERKLHGYTMSDQLKQQTSKSLKAHYQQHPKKLPQSKLYMCRKCNQLHQTKLQSKQCCPSVPRPIKVKIPAICGPYSRLRICNCKVCKISFTNKTQVQYCSNCRDESSNIRSHYKFRFNLYHYPQLFDLQLLDAVGFYAPGGKSGRWNLDGLSRDHKVSVSEAIKCNYDKYYITHPLNCELMPHRLNDSKNDKSSITYEELVEAVDRYDSNILVM